MVRMAPMTQGADTMAKVTPWYPPEVKPVRVGWYACQQCTISRSWRNRHWWTGRVWLQTGRDTPHIQVPFNWRGLRSPATTSSESKEG